MKRSLSKKTTTTVKPASHYDARLLTGLTSASLPAVEPWVFSEPGYFREVKSVVLCKLGHAVWIRDLCESME